MSEPSWGAEGNGHPAPNSTEALAPDVVIDPESLFYLSKKEMDGSLAILKLYSPNICEQVTSYLQHTRDLSTRPIAALFRDLSNLIWTQNSSLAFFKRLWGIPAESYADGIPIQKECNNYLWARNEDGGLNHVTSDDFTALFKEGDQANWPNLVLTSNHARASKSDDLTELTSGFTRIAGDAWKKTLAVVGLSGGNPPKNVKGKTIVAMAVHTEKDIFLNGARLIDRRLDLLDDQKGIRDPSQRTLKHLSPAAMRLAKLMMKLLIEPAADGTKLVDLDRAKDEYLEAGNPFVADAHDKNLVLRKDAGSIAQHIKLVGYSRGANTVTDALRFFYQECAKLGDRLEVYDKQGDKVLSTSDAGKEAIRHIISNVGLMTIAPGEVPLTDAEKRIVGIQRSTILNTLDFTAGHLVNPNIDLFDPWCDRLVKIEGAPDQSGHSITKGLGTKDAGGYIMDPTNAGKENYIKAQDEVRAFFASNHGIHAATTLCLSPDKNEQSGNTENTLLIQFAPGVTRAEGDGVAQIKQKLVAALQAQGFTNPTVKDDFTHRRRLQVVLDTKGADQPIILNDSGTGAVNGADVIKVGKCLRALQSINDPAKNKLFFTSSSLGYLQELMDKYTPGRHAAGVLSGRGQGGYLGR